MSKEYKLYRVLAMIYVLIINNIMLFIFEGFNYYLWFLSSILMQAVLLLNERIKMYRLLKWPGNFTISREWIFLIVFLISYPKHYQSYRHLNYFLVAMLQIVNVMFFTLLFCIKDKDSHN